ncbi:hypothetical protein KL86DPRO_20273 [uncultured delta proteobacterium]|uniref:Uncharacterized protein n=1 Tax=uncultured delta proteobacterium TaxID=34034 RepID=A0A212JXP5_9DELT|nr:hypothetical protein KL86DPRO_20273 [uncultured delta proteobacterium]
MLRRYGAGNMVSGDARNILAERKGLEPSASGVTGRRYNRLNYRSKKQPQPLYGKKPQPRGAFLW